MADHFVAVTGYPVLLPHRQPQPHLGYPNPGQGSSWGTTERLGQAHRDKSLHTSRRTDRKNPLWQ